MLKFRYQSSVFIKLFFTIFLSFYITQQLYPLNDFVVIKTIILLSVVLLGLIKLTYRNLSKVPLKVNIGFSLLLLLSIVGVARGFLSDFLPRNIFGDAYKLILLPLLFYFFYLNISSRENFYSILLFLSKLLVVCGLILIFLHSVGVLGVVRYGMSDGIPQAARFNFLYGYIPFIYLLIVGNKNKNNNIPIMAMIFLLCLIPFTKGIGSLVALMVFLSVLLFRSRHKIRFILLLVISTVALSSILVTYVSLIDERVLGKVMIFFSNNNSLYVLEYIMAGRLTETASVLFGKNLIFGNGFGANLTPYLLHESLSHWYYGLLISNSHSMHSVLGELTLRTGLLSFFIVFLFYIFLAKRSYQWKSPEGNVIFAISIMLIQEALIGQSLSDAFIVPMFFLAYIIKFGPYKKSSSMINKNLSKSNL